MPVTATANGQTFTFPDGTTPEQMGQAIDEFFAGQAAPQESENITDRVLGALDAGATIASSIVAEPISGVAGIVQSMNPFASDGAGARAVEATREALTFQTRSELGRQNLQSVGEALSPVVDVLESAEQTLGDAGNSIAGPVGGAIGASIPTAVGEVLGVGSARGGLRSAQRARDISRAQPDVRSQQILDAGEKLNVPVFTSDVAPPDSFLGGLAVGLSEKLGPLGTGRARANQQLAREEAVRGFADSFDVDIDTDFARGVVDSVNRKTASQLQRGGEIREEAVQSLDQFGEVNLSSTQNSISREIERQRRLGDRADTALLDNLNRTRSALEGGDFSLVKDIRTEVIKDIQAIRRGEDTRAAGSLQQVKDSIDSDLLNFARTNDRDAAAKWVRSNRIFADAFQRTKDTELKRILRSGDATPEKIIPVIRGGKPSELRRLRQSIDDEGITAVRGAIIQDALKDSRFFQVDESPNPDAFATALNRPNRQQAINAFFDGQSRAEIDGLTRLLDSTRRAQQANTVVRTGEQFAPAAITGAVGAGIVANPALTLGLATTAKTISSAYESKTFRNLLLRLRNTKKGSAQENSALIDLGGILAPLALQEAATQQGEQATQ